MEVDRADGAIAGVVAAGAALAVGELVTAFDGAGRGLVSAVGDRFIEGFAGALKDVAVALFGTNDKVALVVGIVVVALALGALLGTARPLVARLAFPAFGALGAWAYGGALGLLAGALAALAGIGALAALRRVPAPARAPNTDPTVTVASRRQFLGFAGALGAGAAGTAALAGRIRTPPAANAEIALPAPVATTAIPAGVDLGVGASPYLTPVADFFRIDTALVVPRVDVARWSVAFTGRVDRPFTLTFDELLALDSVEVPVTLQCVSNTVGGELVGTAMWQGVELRTLLERAGVQPGGTQVVGRSVDGFTAGFPTALLDDDRIALLAYAMNGEPLTPTHGFPARLVVGGLYGYVSATKWLEAVDLTGLDDFDGFWIPRGWSKDGPIKVASRIDVPRSGAPVAAGTTPVAGVAWCPTRGIAAVEVSVDQGPWEPAELGDAANDQTWVQWLYRWDAVEGLRELRVRATTVDGEVQTEERAPPAPDGATGLHARLVRVSP